MSKNHLCWIYFSDILDELRLISLSVPKLIASFNEASDRCLNLSEGCLYPILIDALEECLGKYLERFTNLVSKMIFYFFLNEFKDRSCGIIHGKVEKCPLLNFVPPKSSKSVPS